MRAYATRSRAGVMSNSLSELPDFKRDLRDQEFAAAEAAGVTTLATVFHARHRELVQYSPGVTFEIINAIELLGERMGIRHVDLYRQLVLLQDIDATIAESARMVDEYSLPPAAGAASRGLGCSRRARFVVTTSKKFGL
ncbi:hypothetical protein [Acidisphaera sp. L21]|uniref:hypothetical protein n=1 Tax=Acidisphaera sp. L21 TaxID=1641851 RepID=UPI00131EA5E8|nr:hypothetical protein [Acidisphaera sp. L21]